MEHRFKVRRFLHEDFASIKQWCDARNFPMPIRRFLPPTAVMVVVDGINVACGFLFRSDADIAVIAHLFSDPAAMKHVRQEAVTRVIEKLEEIAEFDGFGMVTCSTNIVSLGKRFEGMGFEATDEKVEHYRKFLTY